MAALTRRRQVVVTEVWIELCSWVLVADVEAGEAPWAEVHEGEDRVHQEVTLEEGEGAFHGEAYLQFLATKFVRYSINKFR